MEIRTQPNAAIPDEEPTDEEKVALGYRADDETAAPSDDDTDWWLPDETDLSGSHPQWKHRTGAWCPTADEG